MSFETIEWSLAKDHEFLEELTKHSNDFINRVKDIPTNIDALAVEVSDLNLKLQNVIGELNSLSEKRFIEHRVADVHEVKPTPESKSTPKASTEVDVKQVVQQGLKAFGLIPADELTDHEDMYKDFVASRPFPPIIGSKEWSETDLFDGDSHVQPVEENSRIVEAMQDLAMPEIEIEEATEASEWFERESTSSIQNRSLPECPSTADESITPTGSVFNFGEENVQKKKVALDEPKRPTLFDDDDEDDDDGDLFGLPKNSLLKQIPVTREKPVEDKTVSEELPVEVKVLENESKGKRPMSFLDELKKKTDKRLSVSGDTVEESERQSIVVTKQPSVTQGSTQINKVLDSKRPSLFGDDTDSDELSTKPNKLPTLPELSKASGKPIVEETEQPSEQNIQEKPAKKKQSIFDDSESDNELFGGRRLSVKSVPKVYPSKHVGPSTTIVNSSFEAPKPAVVKVQLQSPKKDPEVVSQLPTPKKETSSDSEEEKKSEAKPKPKSIFDDDDSSDDLFSPKTVVKKIPEISGPKPDNEDRRKSVEEIFKSRALQSVPKTPLVEKTEEKVSKLFDDSTSDEESDLFGAKVTKKVQPQTEVSSRVVPDSRNEKDPEELRKTLTATEDSETDAPVIEKPGTSGLTPEDESPGSSSSVREGIGAELPVSGDTGNDPAEKDVGEEQTVSTSKMSEKESNVKKMAMKLPVGLLDGLKAKQQQLGIAVKQRSRTDSGKSSEGQSGGDESEQIEEKSKPKIPSKPVDKENQKSSPMKSNHTDVVKIARNRVRGPPGRRLPTMSKNKKSEVDDTDKEAVERMEVTTEQKGDLGVKSGQKETEPEGGIRGGLEGNPETKGNEDEKNAQTENAAKGGIQKATSAKPKDKNASIFAADSSDDDLFTSKKSAPKRKTPKKESSGQTTSSKVIDPLSTPLDQDMDSEKVEVPAAKTEVKRGLDKGRQIEEPRTGSAQKSQEVDKRSSEGDITVPQSKAKTMPASRSLFDESSSGESSEELFGKKPPALVPSRKKSLPKSDQNVESKKPPHPPSRSLFDDSDDSDDLFKKK